MSPNYNQIVLQYQTLENAAQLAWIRKATEAHDLRNTISWSDDPEFTTSLKVELLEAEKEAAVLLRGYYLSQIETAKVAKNTLFLEFGHENPEAFEQIIAPMWDDDIFRLEEEVRKLDEGRLTEEELESVLPDR